MSEPRSGRGEDRERQMFWEPALVFLSFAFVFILAGSAAFLIALFAFAPDQPLRALGPAGTALVALAAWSLLHRGKTEAAVWVLAYGFWAVVTTIAFFTGGVNGMAIIAYPQIILLLGWMIGTRAAVAMAVVTIATTLCFTLAESSGMLPPAPQTPPILRWLVQSLVFVFAVVLFVYVVRAYQNRIDDVNELDRDLNRAQAVAHIGSWVYDLSSDTLRLSAETCRIFGVPVGATANHDIYLSRVHPDDRARVVGAWQEALTGGEAFDNEHRILVGDSVRWVRQKAELELRADGAPLRSVGTTQDITERKRKEDEYHTIIQASIDGFWITDFSGRILDVNDSICRTLGYARSEMLRLSIRDIDADESSAQVEARTRDMVKKGSARFQARHRRKDGGVLDVEVSVLHLQTLGERLFVFVRDLTERKRAEAARAAVEGQLRESQKMEALGTLAGGVAHDFNNIVAAIIGNAELARQDVGPGHPALESLEEIRKASHRAKNLVQQILAFGRRQVLARKVMSLAPVVGESARLLRSTLPAGINLVVECAPDAPEVLADATQIEQVLLNLCNNAWQAMLAQARPGAIEIRLAAHLVAGAPYQGPERRCKGERIPLRAGRYACLMVRDNGPGMDPATRSHIFEPFFTTKPVGEGTGLGLAVVHGIVHDHDASIAVQSAPGLGTTFRIFFPAAHASGGFAPARAGGAAGANGCTTPVLQGEGMHILYLDDDEAIMFLMTRLLQRHGYRVSGHSDPAEALAAVRAEPGDFDLVVTDYNMPGTSGLEVARALKEIRPDLPVALASGYITEELRAQAPAAGVRELIYKPNTAEDFCQIVARLVNTLPASAGAGPDQARTVPPPAGASSACARSASAFDAGAPGSRTNSN